MIKRMASIFKIFLTTAIFSAAAQAYAVNPAAPAKPIPVSPAEKAKIEQVVHDYLVQQPEVLVEAMQTLQRRQFDQAQQTVKQTQQIANNFADALFHQPNDPIAGNPNGKITVVEFFDYQCPHCVDMAPTMAAVIKANPDLRVVYKEFPIRGPVSDYAAHAAIAANKQGKYLAFSHALLTSPTQPLTPDLVLQIAKSVGLNIDQLKKDMTDKSTIDQIKNNLALAQNLKLFGTPAIFIGKTELKNNQGNINYVPGQMDQSQLQTAIDQAKK